MEGISQAQLSMASHPFCPTLASYVLQKIHLMNYHCHLSSIDSSWFSNHFQRRFSEFD
jgi:hypothetical protein